LAALWPAAAMNGGAVSPGTAMAVNIAPGYVAIPVQSGATTALCAWDAVESVALNPAPGAGLNRIDVIYAQARGNDIDSGSNNDFIFNVLTGTAAATPVAPSPLPANSVAVAQVFVPAQSANVTAANITQSRLPSAAVPPQGVPAGRLYPSTQTVLATATSGQITLGTTDYLFGGMATTNNALVVPVAGIYRVAASIAWQISNGQVPASQFTFTMVYRSSPPGAAAMVRQWAAFTNWATWLECSAADDIRLNAGDQLTLFGMQNTGGAAGSFPLADRTYLSAHLVSTGP
jgi:hypothetical protein